MDFPGLDVKKMSDDELLKRVSELHGKLLYAYTFSGSQELLNQMQAMLDTLEFEQSDRMQRRVWEAQQKKLPKIIETEPDLVEKKEVVQTSKKPLRAGIGGGGLLRRSKTPSAE